MLWSFATVLGCLDVGCPTRGVNWQPSTNSIARVAHTNAPPTTCRAPIADLVVCEPSADTGKKQLSAVYAPKGVSIGKTNVFAHVCHKV